MRQPRFQARAPDYHTEVARDLADEVLARFHAESCPHCAGTGQKTA